MATGTDHVRWGRPNRDDCGDDGWATALLRDVGRKGTGRRYTSDGLCVTGRSRLRGHRETVRWRSLFTHIVCLWMCDGLRSTWFQMAINPCWMLLDLVERSLFYWPKTFFHVKSQISCGDSHDRQFHSERFNQPLHLTKQVLLACTTIFPFHLNLAFLCLLVDAFVYDFIWLYF